MEQPSAVNQTAPIPTFRFLSYYFDKRSFTANFCYQGIDNTIFTEKVVFAQNPEKDRLFNVTDDPSLNTILDRAMFLAFIAIGTSYYKAHPTQYVQLDIPIDDFQAYYFNKIYQEGLSQVAYENNLTRDYLAHFYATYNYYPDPALRYRGQGILSLQSGGKDSILTATMLNEQKLRFTPWYLSDSSERTHPLVIDNLGREITQNKPASIAVREIDFANLQRTNGLNGHAPTTLIIETLALVQAILFNQNVVLTSIAQEGAEPSTMIADLPVNHQWSKTWEAEDLLAQYVERYISPDIIIGSPIRHMSEMFVAKHFAKRCWERYGYAFSSCKIASYRQFTNDSQLPWCGNCPRCANTYLLFAPFLPPAALQSLFADQELFTREDLLPVFKGLLGIDNQMKPFECVGSVEELRAAYHARQEGYAKLPFNVPPSSFDYNTTYPVQNRIVELFKKK